MELPPPPSQTMSSNIQISDTGERNPLGYMILDLFVFKQVMDISHFTFYDSLKTQNKSNLNKKIHSNFVKLLLL